MGLTFSSPSLEDAHDVFQPASSYSLSYAFAGTDANQFGIPATLTTLSSSSESIGSFLCRCPRDGPANLSEKRQPETQHQQSQFLYLVD